MINMLSVNPLEAIYLIGIFVGCFMLSIAPYIRKLDKGEVTQWNHAYTLVMLVSFSVSTIASFIVFTLNALTAESPILAFGQGLIVGLASKPTVEELLKRLVPSWFENEE